MFNEDYWTLHEDHRLAPFHMEGQVMPIHAEAMLKSTGRVPRRPLAGWLMVYGTLDARDNVVPLRDRQGHLHEVAKELGRIDWTPYMEKGAWIDNHRWLFPDGTPAPHGVRPKNGKRVHVGRAHTIEFHDGTTPLSKAHRKVGFFTTGELFDRNDPSSWAALGRAPTPEELARADHYWDLAHMLKGTPRPLAFSADGLMAVSKDRAKIMWARVDAAGVCEIPQHPATTAEPMTMSHRPSQVTPHTPFEIMEMAVQHDSLMSTGPTTPRTEGELEVAAVQNDWQAVGGNPEQHRLDLLIAQVAERFHTSRSTAKRWVRDYFKRNPHEMEAFNGHEQDP